jgi:hypothetical protein
MKKTLLGLLIACSVWAATNHSGKVLETLESGGYTYMKVQEGKNSYWIAMTHRDVKVGETIKYEEQGWMKNFHSKTLNRTFEDILFAGSVTNEAPKKQIEKRASKMDSTYQEKGTLSVAQVFANRDKYIGKVITVKGKVTKTSNAIMKLNWLHIQDGSNFSNMNDLVFTSTDPLPAVGETIYAKGVLVKDKDFGYGYFYPVIIQNASFKK